MAQRTRLRGKEKDKEKEEEVSLQQIENRLDFFDQRLDALDTMITAIAERVMKQPITLVITCPKCGSSMDIALVGNEKMHR